MLPIILDTWTEMLYTKIDRNMYTEVKNDLLRPDDSGSGCAGNGCGRAAPDHSPRSGAARLYRAAAYAQKPPHDRYPRNGQAHVHSLSTAAGRDPFSGI